MRRARRHLGLALFVCLFSTWLLAEAPATVSQAAAGQAAATPAQAPLPLTLPNKPDSLKFGVMGDFGTGKREQYQLGEVMARVESARGEMAYTVVSDGGERPHRVRARTGSFMAMGIIEDISPGLMVADLVALIASLDVVAPETDR